MPEREQDTPAQPAAQREPTKPPTRQDLFQRAHESVAAKVTDRRAARDEDAPERGRQPERVERQEGKGTRDKDEDQRDDQVTDPDLDGLPPEAVDRVKRIKASIKGAFTKKTQQLSSVVKEHDEWADTRRAWANASPERRKIIEQAYRGELDHISGTGGTARPKPSDEPETNELDEYLEGIEEGGRGVAKGAIQTAVKLALKESGKTIAELKKELAEIRSDREARTKSEQDAYVQSAYREFQEAVPEYDDLDEDVREDFEAFFEGKLSKDPRLKPLDAWKRFNKHVDTRAPRKAEDRSRDLADAAERAPVSRAPQSGRSGPTQFKTRREIMEHAARRHNIR